MRTRAFFTLLALAGCFAITINPVSGQQINQEYCLYISEEALDLGKSVIDRPYSNCAEACAKMVGNANYVMALKRAGRCFESLRDYVTSRMLFKAANEQEHFLNEIKYVMGNTCGCTTK